MPIAHRHRRVSTVLGAGGNIGDDTTPRRDLRTVANRQVVGKTRLTARHHKVAKSAA